MSIPMYVCVYLQWQEIKKKKKTTQNYFLWSQKDYKHVPSKIFLPYTSYGLCIIKNITTKESTSFISH